MSDENSQNQKNAELSDRSSREHLRFQNALLQQELDELRAENNTLRSDSALLKAVLSSTTWRATHSVRWAVRVTRERYWAVRSLLGAKRRKRKPSTVRQRLCDAFGAWADSTVSPANEAALQAIVHGRWAFVPIRDPARAPAPMEWPNLDLSFVTFNSRRWLRLLLTSVVEQDYPLEKINIFFVDHGSVDGSRTELDGLRAEFGARFSGFEVLTRPNRGFGAGHNIGIGAGSSRFCLVSNVDLTFEKDSLTKVVAMACADDEEVACWELRQKPYEHPKFYDPVTWETNWCSHACVLLRRSAFEVVGGYDEAIFMYGEDVELSYRFRERGLRLRYCPSAVVWHFTYEYAYQVKALQVSGSIFANLYLRLRYGKWTDIARILPLAALKLVGPAEYDGSRRDFLRTLVRLLRVAPSVIVRRRKTFAAFPFRTYDYDLVREGAFVAAKPEPADQPLVSVVTRTIAGRSDLLAQAILSVAHQTYSNIQHIVVEDGGEAQRKVVDRIAKVTRTPVTYVPLPRTGRARAGNAGLAAAKGEFVMFLDDDDLLFADHLSTLMQALREEPEAVAAYSLAWEIPIGCSVGRYVERLPVMNPSMQQFFDPALLRRRNYIPIQAMLFKKRLYLERGGFDPQIDYLEDWNLWNRFAVGNRFSHVPKVTSIFRTPSDPILAAARQEKFDAAYASVVSRNVTMVRAIEERLTAEIRSGETSMP